MSAVMQGELAALGDGPWLGCWYWRTELEAQQQTARDRHARGCTAELGSKAHYQPTEKWIDNPEQKLRVLGQGRVWRYRRST